MESSGGAPQRRLEERHSRREARRATAFLAVLATIAAIAANGLLVSAPAQALLVHSFVGSFGPEGPGKGVFADPQSIAVGPGGNVYVFDDGGEGSIYRFNANGEPADFAGRGTNVITSVGKAGPNEAQIAVDSSSGPTRGDIYLANAQKTGGVYAVRVYASEGEHAGEKIGELSEEAGHPWGEPCGVAVDPAGHAYVGLASGFVNKYTPTGSYMASLSGLDAEAKGPGEPSEICNVAVDAEESAYVATFSTFSRLTGPGRVRKYAALQFSPGPLLPAEGTTIDEAGATLATDAQIDGPVWIHEQNDLAEYETTGEPRRLSETGASEPGRLSESFGVAVTGAAGHETLYADSSTTGGVVNIYGPREVVALRIDSEYVSAVAASSATLNTQINPLGLDTHYYFQYGAADCAAKPSPCASVPAAPGRDIGSGKGDVSESLHLQNLEPDTTYHYRVIASNALGEVEGPDRTFTTQPLPVPFALPDGRAYELVSPPHKDGGEPSLQRSTTGVVQAAADGEAIAWQSNQSFAEPQGNPLGSQYLSTRTFGGWSTENITTTGEGINHAGVGTGGEYRAFSRGISSALVRPEAPRFGGVPYLRDLATGVMEPLFATQPSGLELQGFRELEGGALSDVVFASSTKLTANAPAEHLKLYEWTNGGLQLVSVLPSTEEPDHNNVPVILNPQSVPSRGSLVYWSDGVNLYVRDMSARKTVQVDGAQGGSSGGGAGVFRAASADGSRVFFTDREPLTPGTHLGEPEQGDLYVFEPATRHLVDLTKDERPEDVAKFGGPGLQGVLGASEDGATVYFVANGVLAEGASRGSCEPSRTNGAVQRESSKSCSLYVAHFDAERATWEAPRFIATLTEGDLPDWAKDVASRTSRVSPHGRWLAFMSEAQVTGYDNRDAVSEVPAEEVYLYDADKGRLVCASCDPSGARPAAELDNGVLKMDNTHIWGSTGPGEWHWVAGSVPTWEPISSLEALYQPHYLSDSGRLFFDGSAALVAQDTNGKEDVYEWEPAGVGGCVVGVDQGGCVDLISSGKGAGDSSFLDASESGNDVFFRTSQALVPEDVDTANDIYDARVCSAASPCIAAPTRAPAPCASSDACKPGPTPQPGIFGSPPSATFSGAGNPASSVQGPSNPPESLTRSEKLARALKACGRGARRKRAACEAAARRRYGARPSRTKKPTRGRRP